MGGAARGPPNQQEDFMGYRVVSADDHIDLTWLPKDLWQKLVPAQWREPAPKVVGTPEGPHCTGYGDRWGSWGGPRGTAGAHGARPPVLGPARGLQPSQ